MSHSFLENYEEKPHALVVAKSFADVFALDQAFTALKRAGYKLFASETEVVFTKGGNQLAFINDGLGLPKVEFTTQAGCRVGASYGTEKALCASFSEAFNQVLENEFVEADGNIEDLAQLLGGTDLRGELEGSYTDGFSAVDQFDENYSFGVGFERIKGDEGLTSFGFELNVFDYKLQKLYYIAVLDLRCTDGDAELKREVNAYVGQYS